MTVPGETTPPEGQEPEGEQLPENFRKRLDQLQLENKVKDDLILDMVFRNKVDITKGLGKTARANYKGELTDEAIEAYLRENYEWEPREASTPAAAAVGQAIAQAQTRIQNTGQGEGTQSGNNEASIQQQIDEAEAKGNWTEAMALKKRWFGELMFGNRGR